MSQYVAQFASICFVICGAISSAAGEEILVRNADELKVASRQVRPGDSIVLADGIWRDVELLLDAQGTPDAPIRLRAETPGGVLITGHSRVRVAGEHAVVSGLLFHEAWHESALFEFRKDSKKAAQDCRLTECAMIDCNPPQSDRGMKYVSLYGRRNRVDHCRLEGKCNEGATVVVWLDRGPAEHRIDHVHFGPRPRLRKNGGETIRVGDSKTSMVIARTVVEDNYFEECDGEVEIISNKSCENVYRSNTFVRCEGALTLRHGNRCLVEGNYFLGQGKRHTGGVRIIGEDHRVVNNYFADLQGDEARAAVSMMNGIPNTALSGYSQVKGVEVAFNTFVNCKWSLAIGLGDKPAILPPENCVIANNLFLVPKERLLDQQTDPQAFVWQGNLVQMSGAFPAVVGRRVADLGLRPQEDGVWLPSQESPAVGAAVGEFLQVTMDIDGRARNSAKDVGCHQLSESKVSAGPVTLDEVGISWSVDR